jgi:adenylate kinase family enzyme
MRALTPDDIGLMKDTLGAGVAASGSDTARSARGAPQPSRVAVVGASCSGKTTFARSLGGALGVPHTELDALYWGPDWTPVPVAQFRSRVGVAVAEPAWVIDGNYAAVRDLVWGNATTLVWLNYPFRLVFPRAVRRTLRRIITRETLFAGNLETFAVADPDWIPWWVLRTFWRLRRRHRAALREPPFSHLQVLEFARPSEAARYLAAFGPPATSAPAPP